MEWGRVRELKSTGKIWSVQGCSTRLWQIQERDLGYMQAQLMNAVLDVGNFDAGKSRS